MKRTLKTLAAVALVIVLCMSMTGCMKIDKMREHQGYVDEKGNIVVNDVTYIMLPYCEFLSPKFSYDYYGILFSNSDSVINLTDKDMPVLLSNFTDNKCRLSEDGMFIVKDGIYDYNGNYYESYYCHEDIYDEILAAIETGYTPDGYKYYYTDYESEEYYDAEYILTDAQVNAINRVLSTVSTIDELPDDLMELYRYEYYTEIYSFTKDMPFEQYEFEIYQYDSGYYIYKSYWSAVEGEWYYEEIYPVPEEFNKTFDEITAKTKEEAMKWLEYEDSYFI